MVVFFEGPKGGKIDIGLQAYATHALNSFAKQLNIHRLKTNITIKFHHNLFVDSNKTCEGLCEAIDRRNFIIDVALYGNWLSTLAHEMVHVKQFARCELDENLTRWKGRDHASTEYMDQPWEKEARKLQYKMVENFDSYEYK